MGSGTHQPSAAAEQSYVDATQGDDSGQAETWLAPAPGGDQGEPSQDEPLLPGGHNRFGGGTMLLVDSTMGQLSTGSGPEPLPMRVGDDRFQLPTENRCHTLGDSHGLVWRRLEGPTPPQAHHSRFASSADALVENTLAIEWRRPDTEGAGVDLLVGHTALAAFVVERIPIGAALAKHDKKKPSPLGRDRDYNSVDETLRAGIRRSTGRRGTSSDCFTPSPRSTPALSTGSKTKGIMWSLLDGLRSRRTSSSVAKVGSTFPCCTGHASSSEANSSTALPSHSG